MLTEPEFKVVTEEAVASGLLRGLRDVLWFGTRAPASFRGTATVAGIDVEIEVLLPISFPLQIPLVLLTRWDAVGFVPHVGPDGHVCYQSAEGLVLDRQRPGAVVVWALERSIYVLERGVARENAADFVDEFEVSWYRLPGVRWITNVLDPPAASRDVCVVEVTPATGSAPPHRAIAGSINDVAGYFGWDAGTTRPTTRATCLVFPSGTLVVPPRHDAPFWTAEELRAFARPALEAMTPKRRHALVGNHFHRSGTVAFVIPRPSGGVVVFAVDYEGGNGRHPLQDNGGDPVLHPVSVSRVERTYLVPRGGGSADLSGKRVLLVGCGAVGGHVAHELVRAGILGLTLVDPDTFSADNTFRHVLGRAFGPKASTLRNNLRASYPYVRAEAVDEKIEVAVEAGTVDLRSFDLVVVAVGAPTVELWLNELLRRSGGPPAVFTWLEPYGIGGHALLMRPCIPGCFECLFTSPAPGPDTVLVNRASFAAPGQWFGRALSGCGTLHTPFGSLDASRTAGLAVRLALDALTGRETKGVLRSWKGPSQDFLDAGFELAPRHGVSEEALNREGSLHVASDCRACSERAPL